MRILAALALCSGGASAQDLSGDWQGALGPAPLRLILHVEKGDGAAWKATLASIDQSPDWGAAMPVDAVTVEGSKLEFSVAAVRGTYSGTIAADGNSIDGTWSQGRPLPLSLVRATPETAWKDPSPHSVRFVTVDTNVKLEVLEWAGPQAGNVRTLVLVPGLGNTAHIFDTIAPKLAAHYHVVGVTRRGFGASSAPSSGYAADRLGDDVLAVIEVLSISRPVARRPFAWRRRAELHRLAIPRQGCRSRLFGRGLLVRVLRAGTRSCAGAAEAAAAATHGGDLRRHAALHEIPPPILAIYALPHAPGTGDASLDVKGEAIAKAFEAALPNAHVVRLPQANHFVFLSNETDVLREMEAFLGTLK